jgi:hypothetical protein
MFRAKYWTGALCALLAGCAAGGGPAAGLGGPAGGDTAPADTGGDGGGDGVDTAPPDDTGGSPLVVDPRDFAASIVAFVPGEGAGYGQDRLPDVVLGRPQGGGGQGSLDVLSLGRDGSIVLAFDGRGLVDGPGPDLLVFENPFPGWLETGIVSVSEDGAAWHTFPCAATDAAGGFPGCAGVESVWAHPDNGLDPTDPAVAGGDAFDLAALGLPRARFVRVVDSGLNPYEGVAGGFDLDAIAIVNGEDLP